MLVSTYKYWIKSIPFWNLKYEYLKNEDCSLTYPNLKEKRKQIDVVSGVTCHIIPYSIIINHRKVLVEDGPQQYFFVVLCK